MHYPSSIFTLLLTFAASSEPTQPQNPAPQGPDSSLSNAGPFRGCSLYSFVNGYTDDFSDGHCQSLLTAEAIDGSCACDPSACAPTPDPICSIILKGEIVCDFDQEHPFRVQYLGGGWVPLCDTSVAFQLGDAGGQAWALNSDGGNPPTGNAVTYSGQCGQANYKVTFEAYDTPCSEAGGTLLFKQTFGFSCFPCYGSCLEVDDR